MKLTNTAHRLHSIKKVDTLARDYTNSQVLFQGS